MMERTAAQTAALAEELRNVVRHTHDLVAALGEDRDAALLEIRDRVGLALSTAKARLVEIEQEATALHLAARTVADAYVRENPWTAVALAAAIGMLVGSFVSARTDEE